MSKWIRIDDDKTDSFHDYTFVLAVEGGSIYRTMTIIKRYWFFQKVLISMIFVPHVKKETING